MKILSILVVCATLLCAQTVESISSDFTQTITSAEGEQLKYIGNFQALSENGDNFALWNYRLPFKKKIYYTNSEVVMIEPDLEQVVITSINDAVDIADVLKNAVNTNKKTNSDVNVTVLDTTYRISFEKHLPAKISYRDKLDNNIEISLKNVLLNVNLDKLTFKPEVPKNYDVVRY